MKGLRKVGISVALALLAVVLADEFMGECFSLAWHVRHGRKAHLQGYDGRKYELRVPILWWASEETSGWSVSINKRYGSIRNAFHNRSWSWMFLSVDPMYQTAEELRKHTPEFENKTGIKMTEVASVSSGGQDLFCFERHFTRGEIVKAAASIPIVDLECVPLSDKRFTASYSGNADLVPEFYDVLKSVRRVD